MVNGTRLHIVAACTLLVVNLSAISASAQEEPPAADVAAARALGQEGVKLADAGNCQEAIDKLQRAEKMFHAPTTLVRLGECQIQVGKIVEGTENLNKVVREVLPASAPPAFTQAQERAKKALAEARPRIARLKVVVAAPPDATLTVKIDGEPMSLASLNTNRPTDPGEHVVDASAPGYKPASAKVHLAEGGNDSIALTLEVDPNAPKPSPSVTTSPSKGATHDSSSRVPAYIALGVGVVGVGVGTVFGLMASSKAGDLDKVCPDKICPGNEQSTIDSAQTVGTVSTIGFIVGGVGLISGAYLFFTSGSKPTRAARRIDPYVGIDRVGVTGTF